MLPSVNQWDEGKKARGQQFKKIHQFRTNAFKLIFEMVKLCSQTSGSSHLVDEILYSIFFFGQIIDPNGTLTFSPEDILDDGEEPKLSNALKEKYSKPFSCIEQTGCRLLPRRSPFSCVLDMVVLKEGPEMEEEITNRLKDIVNSLNPNVLVSHAICVSKFNDSVKQYGVSMSYCKSNKSNNNIFIGAACSSGFWNDYVADAVMTYYPGNEQRRDDFNGTFTLPNGVTCMAYNIRDGRVKDPCRLCMNLFGLSPQPDTDEEISRYYGNCAEAESLSNLLNENAEITPSLRGTLNNREQVITHVKKHLKEELSKAKFRWNNEFYKPE